MYRQYGKRLLDLGLALPTLLLLSPMLLLLAVFVRVRMGSPIFFRQERPGQEAKPFTMMKFRTMADARDKQGALLSDEKRLTNLGRWLRKTSLDELPELINVIRGEMSLIGPRPLLIHYLDRYSPHQMRRHEVRPGISGWAQINGRNIISWEEKFDLDIWYVDNYSLRLDIKIIALTIQKTLAREGISQPGHATMEEFNGSPSSE